METAAEGLRPKRLPLPVLLAAFAALVAVFLAKAPDGLTRPQLWAEDGAVFFAEQRQLGWQSLFVPYSGYLETAQRLVAGLASLFPAGWAPLLYYLAAVTACALAALAIASPRGGCDARSLLVLPVLLVPAGGELLGTLTNVHWTFQFYLLVLLFQSTVPRTRAGRTAELAAAALLSLTGIFSILLAPLYLLRRLLRRRSRRDPETRAGRRYFDTLTAILLTGALVQALLVWKTGEGTAPGGAAYSPREALGWILQGLQTHFFTVPLLTPVHFLAALLAFAGALAAAACFSACRFEMLCCALFLLEGLAGCYLKLWHFLPVLVPFDNGDRYFFAAKVLVWWLATYAILGLPWSKAVRRGALGALVALLALYACAADRFVRPPLADLDWPRYVPAIESRQPVQVPINPPGWVIDLGR